MAIRTISLAMESPWDCYRLYTRGLLEDYAGRPALAMSAYQEALRRDPGAGFLNESLAEVALAAGRNDVALEAARQAVTLSTGSSRASLLLGRAYLALGDHAQAQAALERALKIDPSNTEALGWAVGHLRMDDPREARRLYENFLSTNPDSHEVRNDLAEIQRRQGDLVAAEKSYKKVLSSDPGNPQALLGLAGLYDVRKETAPAIDSYETYLKENPDQVEVLTRLSQLYYVSGRWEEARITLQRALSLSPEDSAVHFLSALVAKEEGRWDEAILHMERVAHNNHDPGILLRLASFHVLRGNPKEAVRVLRRLQRSQPDNPDFMYNVALAYEDQGNPRAAIRWLKRALAKDSNHPDILFHLAVNWERLKRYDRVEKCLLKTIDLSPDHALALNFLGYTWADRNTRLAEALSLVQRAVALDPENLAYRDSLGWAYFRLGRLVEAETALSSTVHRANDPVVWSHFGDLLDALGRRPEAMRAWQEGLLLSPNDRGLLKRLGEEDRSNRAVPAWAPRTLLKRVEGNYRQLSALSGVADLRITTGGRDVSGQGLFYFSRPNLFRLEVLGPFLTPQAVMVYDGSVHWSPTVSTSGEEKGWLKLWGDVLTGDFFKRFDDPAVVVRREGTTLIYLSSEGELRLDTRGKNLLEAKLSRAEGGPVALKFRSTQESEGLLLPLGIEGTSETEDVRFTLHFSRLTVNPRLNPALFVPVP